MNYHAPEFFHDAIVMVYVFLKTSSTTYKVGLQLYYTFVVVIVFCCMWFSLSVSVVVANSLTIAI